jgi:uncharacterized protein YutE (UPF0331/DUF86 family)
VVRNRIARGYASVDVEALFHDLPGGVTAFRTFAERVAAYLVAATP